MRTDTKTPITPTSLAGPPWAPIALAGTVLTAAAFGWIAVSALRTPPETVTITQESLYAQELDYRYTARAEPGLVYPDGFVGPVEPTEGAEEHPLGEEADEFTEGVRPPQALYSNLIDELELVIGHRLQPADGASLTGEHRTALVLETADGWTSREPLAEPVPVDSDGSTVEAVVDVQAARATLAEVAEVAGANLGSGRLAVESEISVSGEAGGEPVDETLTETFGIRLSDPVLQPTGDLARTHTAERSVESRVEHRVAGLPVPWARGIGVAGLLSALIATAWLVATMLLGWRRPEHEAIAARYGSLVVTVHDNPIRGAKAMRVSSISALVRLAKREHTVMLHEPRTNGRHRYVVPDGLVAFYYETGGAEVVDPAAEADTFIVLDDEDVGQPASGGR